MTKIVCAFIGSGKTTFAASSRKYVATEIHAQKYKWRGGWPNVGARIPDAQYAHNYVAAIQRAASSSQYDVVFASTPKLILDELAKNHLPYCLIYPSRDDKAAWLQRLSNREVLPSFLKRMSRNWDKMMDDLERDERAIDKIVLHADEVIDDALMARIFRDQPHELTMKFPARVQMCPLDFTKFDIQHRTTGFVNGGGYGFAIKMNNEIKAAFANRDEIIAQCHDDKLLARHVLHAMRRFYHTAQKFHVEISLDRRLSAHMGFGSSAVLQMAVASAINALLGEKLGHDALVDFVAQHYVEIIDGKIVRSYTTGVSLHAFLRGGFVVVGDKAQLIFQTVIPSRYKAFLVDAGTRRVFTGPENLDQVVDSIAREQIFVATKLEAMLMQIIPALRRGNWEVLRRYNREFQIHGGQQAVIDSYENPAKIYRMLNEFAKLPDTIAGVSSCGPGIFVLTSQTRAVREICTHQKYRFSMFDIENRDLNERLR